MSLNVTVTDGARYVTDLEEGEIRGLRGRRQAADHVLLAACSSRSRSPSCSTPARAWTSSSRRRRKRRSASPGACSTDDVMEVIDFDSQVRILQTFTNDVAALETGDPADHGQRLDLALQRHLHLAEGAEEGHGRPAPTRSGARRSSCCPTATTPRAWSPTTKCSTSRSDRKRRSTRSACGSTSGGRREFKEAEFVLRQLSQETGGRAFFPATRRRAAEDLRADLRGAGSQYTHRLHRRRTRCATAPGAAIVVRVDQAGPDRRGPARATTAPGTAGSR